MSTYKLVYFDVRCRGELPSLIMNYAGIPFEYCQINKAKEWGAMKHTVLFEQLPYLEVDGHILSETRAICRFLAKKAGLAGKDEFETALVDMILCRVDDVMPELVKVRYAPEDQKVETRRKFIEDKLPQAMGKFEKYLEKGSGYLVGDKLSAADLALFSILDVMEDYVDIHCDLTKFPKLTALIKMINSDPKIVHYLVTRK